MSTLQKTIKKEITLSGVGLHTGNKVTMTFKPAPENSGYAFVRIDLEGEPVIEASAEYVVNTQRGTNLEKRGVLINTSEHVLAAVVALDIDNIIIEPDNGIVIFEHTALNQYGDLVAICKRSALMLRTPAA